MKYADTEISVRCLNRDVHKSFEYFAPHLIQRTRIATKFDTIGVDEITYIFGRVKQKVQDRTREFKYQVEGNNSLKN